jgi:UPF0755 protein
MSNLSNYNFRNTKVLMKNLFKNVYRKVVSIIGFISIFLLRKLPKIRLRVNLIAFSLVAFLFLSFSLFSSPSDFPVGAIVTIEEGATLEEIAVQLKEQKVIKSPFVFINLNKALMNGGSIMAGDYFFEEKCSVLSVISRTTTANYGVEPTRVTFVEGTTVYDMANVMEIKFPKFDIDEFLEIAKSEEGYLFPDTYYFLPSVSPQAMVNTMKNNFNKKIEEISEKIAEFGKDLSEIVIMASLLEKEARTLETKRMIAGILWRRIDIDMPLQVDAVFPYIIGKNTYQVTLEDLRVDSPYNTYRNKGLPIGPIANPSLWSLLAAVTPIDSNYLFYLSDRSGGMHYGVDFEQHKSNRYLYLN